MHPYVEKAGEQARDLYEWAEILRTSDLLYARDTFTGMDEWPIEEAIDGLDYLLLWATSRIMSARFWLLKDREEVNLPAWESLHKDPVEDSLDVLIEAREVIDLALRELEKLPTH